MLIFEITNYLCLLSRVACCQGWALKLLPTSLLSLLAVSMFLRMSCQCMLATCIDCQGWALTLLSAPLSQSLSLYWHDDGGYDSDDDNDDDYDFNDDDDDDDVVVVVGGGGGGVIFIVPGSAQQICLGWSLRLYTPLISGTFRQEFHVVCDGVAGDNDLPWLQHLSHHTQWCGFHFKISSGSKKVMARHVNSSGHVAIIIIRRVNTFWRSDVEKVYAVVARSTFGSQKCP